MKDFLKTKPLNTRENILMKESLASRFQLESTHCQHSKGSELIEQTGVLEQWEEMLLLTMETF